MSEPRAPSGLVTAAALARDAEVWGDEAARTAQGSLFGVDPEDADGVGALPEIAPAPSAPRGRGRPPGSRNRSTEEWSRYLLTRYRSPLIGLAEIAQATPKDLQEELGTDCTMVEAVKLIMGAQQALAPYLHQKQPLAVQGAGVGMMTVIIQTGAGDTAQTFDIKPIEETEEYQALSADGVDLSETDGRT